MANQLAELSSCIKHGRIKEVIRLVGEALDQGFSAQFILDEGLLVGMDELGSSFRDNEMSVADMLLASEAMTVGLNILKDKLCVNGVKINCRIIIASVENDLHDIGKSLIKAYFENAGAEIFDLGTDVTSFKIEQSVRSLNPDILALSASLTTTMDKLREIIAVLEVAGLRETVMVIVGGAPVSRGYCSSIGADGYAANATEALHLVSSLIQ